MGGGRDGGGGMGVRAGERVWTVPNILSLARLAAIPVFLWVFLVGEQDLAALVILILSGLTDWLDGWIARRTGTVTRLGALLDPVVDRLFIIATVLALGARGLVPWWIIAGLLLRDVVLTGFVAALRRYDITGIPVRVAGKAATLLLLVALPTLLLGAIIGGEGAGTAAPGGAGGPVAAVGQAILIIGFALYLATGIRYAADAVGMLRRAREADLTRATGGESPARSGESRAQGESE